jgi:ribosomal protein S18 acetylase RimI-like enzyme
MPHEALHHEATPPVALRVATAADAAQLALVGQATFLETYAGILGAEDIVAHCASQHAEAVYAQWLADDHTRIWLAQASPGSAPVGYLVLAAAGVPVSDPRPTDLEIKRIYLLHRFQHQGAGRRMMDAAQRHARASGCERLLLGVYSRNHLALAFYERLGFRRVGERTFRVGNSDYFDYLLGLDI